MKTAVIIPCHNNAQFLDDAIDSLFKQIGTHLHEIIVVDDASDTDESVNVVERKNVFLATTHCREQIRFLAINERSTWEARKAGFLMTTADVICFLDADDMMPPDYFAAGIEQFEKHGPRCGIVYSDMQEFGTGDTYHKYPETGHVNKEILQRANQFHCASLVTRRALEMSDAFSARRPPNGTEDWYLWKQIMEAGFQSAKSRAVFEYRRHPQSMTAAWGPRSHYEDAMLALETVTLVDLTSFSMDDLPTLDWMCNQKWRFTDGLSIDRREKGYLTQVANSVRTGFALILNPPTLPPLDIIETLMRQMVPTADWITHESGAVLVRRSALFNYAIMKYDEAKENNANPH